MFFSRCLPVGVDQVGVAKGVVDVVSIATLSVVPRSYLTGSSRMGGVSALEGFAVLPGWPGAEFLIRSIEE